MRLLITGGLGFIGSNLVRYMLATYPDYEIINIDAQTYAGHPENLSDVANNPNYKYVHGRIEDRNLVNQIVSGKMFGKIDGIMNLAAESHVDRSIEDGSIFVESNIVGTQVLVEAAFKYGLEPGSKPGPGAKYNIKYMQISTDEVYGSLGPTGFFTEETPIQPSSPYSASKAGADMICMAYNHTYNLPVVITRCSNNYGPYQHPEKLIPLFINNLMNDKQVPVYGDGGNIRDWLHVEDHCRAIDVVFHKGVIGQVYNVGGNNEKTNMYITKLLIKELGKTEALIKYVADRLGHDKRYAIDSSKIQRELGWTPKHTFETGIAQTISWYKANTAWLNLVAGRAHAVPAAASAPAVVAHTATSSVTP